MSVHTLRHTVAWFYLHEQPGDIIGLATLLGHRSLDTTRIYCQPALEQLAARVEALALNVYPSHAPRPEPLLHRSPHLGSAERGLSRKNVETLAWHPGDRLDRPSVHPRSRAPTRRR